MGYLTDGRALPGLGLRGGFADGSTDWGDEMNRSLLILSALTQGGVISATTTIPVTGTDGDVYIVPSADPNGNAVAVWDRAQDGVTEEWVYLVPSAGWKLYVNDESKYYVFDGTAWAEFVSGSGDTGGGSGGGSGGTTQVPGYSETIVYDTDFSVAGSTTTTGALDVSEYDEVRIVAHGLNDGTGTITLSSDGITFRQTAGDYVRVMIGPDSADGYTETASSMLAAFDYSQNDIKYLKNPAVRTTSHMRGSSTGTSGWVYDAQSAVASVDTHIKIDTSSSWTTGQLQVIGIKYGAAVEVSGGSGGSGGGAGSGYEETLLIDYDFAVDGAVMALPVVDMQGYDEIVIQSFGLDPNNLGMRLSVDGVTFRDGSSDYVRILVGPDSSDGYLVAGGRPTVAFDYSTCNIKHMANPNVRTHSRMVGSATTTSGWIYEFLSAAAVVDTHMELYTTISNITAGQVKVIGIKYGAGSGGGSGGSGYTETEILATTLSGKTSLPDIDLTAYDEVDIEVYGASGASVWGQLSSDGTTFRSTSGDYGRLLVGPDGSDGFTNTLSWMQLGLEYGSMRVQHAASAIKRTQIKGNVANSAGSGFGYTHISDAIVTDTHLQITTGSQTTWTGGDIRVTGIKY